MDTFKDWILFHKKELVLFMIIFIVAVISFGLGYLANREYNHAPIIIQETSRS